MSRRTRQALLAVAPWPIARALRSATFRRLQGRRTTARYGGYLLAYSIVIAVAVCRYPRFARAIALAACLGTAGELWVERSSSGRRAGLPPGGLPLIPFASVTDRDYVLKHLERNGPVVKAGRTWKADR